MNHSMTPPENKEELQQRREAWAQMMRTQKFRGEVVKHAIDGTLYYYKFDRSDWMCCDDEGQDPEELYPPTCACAWGYAAFAAADILGVPDEELNDFLATCSDSMEHGESEPSIYLAEFFGFEIDRPDEEKELYRLTPSKGNPAIETIIKVNDRMLLSIKELADLVEYLNGTPVNAKYGSSMLNSFILDKPWKETENTEAT